MTLTSTSKSVHIDQHQPNRQQALLREKRCDEKKSLLD